MYRNHNDHIIDTMLIPDEIITLFSGKKFILTSIVIYTVGHYTCCFKCSSDNEWYLYNDVEEPNVKKIGSYNDLNLNKISSQGTQFFYNKV